MRARVGEVPTKRCMFRGTIVWFKNAANVCNRRLSGVSIYEATVSIVMVIAIRPKKAAMKPKTTCRVFRLASLSQTL